MTASCVARGRLETENGPEEVGNVVPQRYPYDGQKAIVHNVDKRPKQSWVVRSRASLAVSLLAMLQA